MGFKGLPGIPIYPSLVCINSSQLRWQEGRLHSLASPARRTENEEEENWKYIVDEDAMDTFNSDAMGASANEYLQFRRKYNENSGGSRTEPCGGTWFILLFSHIAVWEGQWPHGLPGSDPAWKRNQTPSTKVSNYPVYIFKWDWTKEEKDDYCKSLQKEQKMEWREHLDVYSMLLYN